MTAQSRVVALDGLRGIAALMVFVHHVQLPWSVLRLPGMDAGVLVFFALSGYLLYAPFVSRSVDLRGYAIRRLFRIAPAYLVAAIGIGFLFYPDTLSDPIGILTMTHTPVIVAWTLQLEVVFYAVLPIAASVLQQRPNPERILIWIGAASVLTTVAIMTIAIASAGTVRSTDIQTFASFAWAFVPGMLVAQRRPMHVPTRTAVLGVTLIATSVVLDLPAYLDLPAGIGAGLIIAFLVGGPSLPSRLALPASILGALSYSFYLWHEAIIPAIDRPPTWSGAGLALVLSVGVATVVYLVVEQPSIRLGRRLSEATAPGNAPRGQAASPHRPRLSFRKSDAARTD